MPNVIIVLTITRRLSNSNPMSIEFVIHARRPQDKRKCHVSINGDATLIVCWSFSWTNIIIHAIHWYENSNFFAFRNVLYDVYHQHLNACNCGLIEGGGVGVGVGVRCRKVVWNVVRLFWVEFLSDTLYRPTTIVQHKCSLILPSDCYHY